MSESTTLQMDVYDETSARQVFINSLKRYFQEEKGPILFDQLLLALHDHQTEIDQILSGKNKKSVELPCFLELDLMHMIYTNQKLGENFIKCFMKYYAYLPKFVLEIFLSLLAREEK